MKIRQNIEFGSTIALWSQVPDRFLSQGYKEKTSFEEKIKLMAKIKEIKGVDLYTDWDINSKNLYKVQEVLKNYNLKTYIVTADVNSLKEFGRGSVTSPIKASRELGQKKVMEAVDLAEALDCGMVNLWFGQDGYDYPFQADYIWGWEKIIESVKEAAIYARKKDIKIALEYKAREPRTHIFTASAAKMLLIAEKVAMDNVGILIDTGHAYTAGEHISESVAMCKLAGDKLFYVHVNDNYKLWDDDMIVASVHPFEMIEFLYWLERTGYSGPIVLDMFPFREDAYKAAKESIDLIKRIREILAKTDEDKIEELLKNQDGADSMKWLRENFLK